MKRNLMLCAMVAVLILLLTGCGCDHSWYDATCLTPKTCWLCGKSVGELASHTWQDATCIAPRTCTVCKLTEGETVDHQWQAATCASPQTCSVCGETEGEPLPHTWQDATCIAPKTCTVCKLTEGETVDHQWQAATTEAPKTCAVCKLTEGEVVVHKWQKATCIAPKTCTICKLTEGTTAPHKWQAATCTTPKTCTVCKRTEGTTAAHKWQEATAEAPRTCAVCMLTEDGNQNTDPRFTTELTQALQGAWVCDVVVTGKMMGLENFGDVECTLTLEFGDTGRMTQRIKVKDEESLATRLKQYAAERTYASFAEAGLDAEQADQAMINAYGKNINDLVEDTYKDYDFYKLFASFNMDKVYYVEGSNVFKASDWTATFESNAFTITGDKLVIQGISLEQGGPALEWKKA